MPYKNKELEAQFYLRHKEQRRAYSSWYRRTYKDKLSTQRKIRNLRIKLETMAHYGGAECVCCGETTVEFLCFDHIDGGGTQHRKQLGNMGRQFYYWLKLNNYPEGYRILCYNCNSSLGFYGYCPHKKEVVISK